MVPTNELEDLRPPTRRRFVRRIVLGVVVALAAAALIYLLRPAPEEALPPFELQRLSGEGTISSEELRGAPVVINFWASWCVPCRKEAPALERAWQEYKDEGVQFLGVNIQDTEEKARDFVEEEGLTYPIVRDPQQTFARAVDVYGLPVTLFVDSEWRLMAASAQAETGESKGTVVLGAISYEDLSRQIETLLERERR